MKAYPAASLTKTGSKQHPRERRSRTIRLFPPNLASIRFRPLL